MRKLLFSATALAVAFVAVPAAAQQSTNATPTHPFAFGSGNGYTPANSVVTEVPNTTEELAVRAHVSGTPASASTSGVDALTATPVDGIYTFANGTANVGFDFSAYGASSNAFISLTNLLTGDSASFNINSLFDNYTSGGVIQNSEQLGFDFLNGAGPFGGCCGNLHFTPTDNTYRIQLLDPAHAGASATAYAQFGAGSRVTASVNGAVPEPVTWAMMLLGFGGIGASLRRRRRTSASLPQTA